MADTEIGKTQAELEYAYKYRYSDIYAMRNVLVRRFKPSPTHRLEPACENGTARQMANRVRHSQRQMTAVNSAMSERL